MSRARERLQAVQNALSVPNSETNTFLLPDRTRVDFDHLPRAEIRVDSVPVCAYQPLGRAAALLLSAVGTPHEQTAPHVPSYPVLEILPTSTCQISIEHMWAIVYALFVRFHKQEAVPVVLSPEIENCIELRKYIIHSGLGRTALSKLSDPDDLFLLRATFWQGAGTHGYHTRGWLPPMSTSTRHAAWPFPSVQSFTRTSLVISVHPLRPPKPLPGEVLYRRYCPQVKEMLELTYIDIDKDDKVTPHLQAFHKWHNDERVNSGWNERGSLEQHKQYIQSVLNDPAVLPIMMSWNGELMGYLELIYVKENHVATYIPEGARDWDRGIHVLVGEERFRGWERAQAWLRSIHHYIFLTDPRADHAIGEPKASNEAIVQVALGTKMHIETIFDFPYKRSVLLVVPRGRFFKEDML